jgi:hypothetical protein
MEVPMNRFRDPMGTVEARAMLDQLPELYFAVLKSAQIEEHSGAGIRCSFELPVLGKRTMTALTARDAIRAVLVELSEVLTKTDPHDWPPSWHGMSSSVTSAIESRAPIKRDSTARFQAKVRQFTIGVTMPAKLKLSLQRIADQQKAPFAEVIRELASLGFEDFDERSFSEASEQLLSSFLSEVNKWQPSETEQVMVRLDPHLAVRLRSTAKRYRRSASEFGAMCLAHGFVLKTQLAEVEQKVAAVRGSRVRGLAPKVGLGSHAALLSGVLAGSIVAPSKLLNRLGEILEAPEFALRVFFKRSFENRAIPAFKAEDGKPQVFRAASSWQDAVKSLKLSRAETKELLLLDD